MDPSLARVEGPPPPLPRNAYAKGRPTAADKFIVNARHCASTGRDITLCYQTFGSEFMEEGEEEAHNGLCAGMNRAEGVPHAHSPSSSPPHERPQQGGRSGRRRRPVMVLIPGLGSSCHTWRDPFCSQLATASAPPSPPSAPHEGGKGGRDSEREGDERSCGRERKGDAFFVLRMDNRDSGLSTHLDGVPTLRGTLSKLAVTVLPRWWWTWVVPLLLGVAPCLRSWRRTWDESGGVGELWRVLLSPAPPYTVEDMCLDVEALLRGLELDDRVTPVHVMGVSMGGRVAQTLTVRWWRTQAHAAGIRLASVTLIATHSGVPVRGCAAGAGGTPSQTVPARTVAVPAKKGAFMLRFLWQPLQLVLSALLSLLACVVPARWLPMTGSGWSWHVIWAMIRSSSSSLRAETGGATRTKGGDPSSGEGQCLASSSRAVEAATAQRAAYAANFYGGYPPPNPEVYRRVKAIDLTRAPVDADATMRQLYATHLSPPLDSSIRAAFPTSTAAGRKDVRHHRSSRAHDGDNAPEEGEPADTLRVLVLHGMADNTVHFANAIHLAKLYGEGCVSKAVLFPRMGHTIPEELYTDIVAEVKTFCLAGRTP